MNLADDEASESVGLLGALGVLRLAARVSPELRVGIGYSIAMAIVTALGKLSIPILVQQVIDRGVVGGYRPGFVYTACGIAFALTIFVFVASRMTYLRLMTAAENTLHSLRSKAFDHIHQLSLADHTESRRGILVSRVTSDIETIARFAQWGAISWVVNSTLLIAVLIVMAVFSWQLMLVTLGVFALMIPVLRLLQRRQLAAYDALRASVGETLGEISEAVTGAGVIRAYGVRPRARRRLHGVIDDQYRSHMRASRYFAVSTTLGDIFGSIAIALVAGLGAWFADDWGLGVGELVACIFLATLVQTPVSEIGEVLDQTQIAIAGWRKVLEVLEMPIDVVDSEDGLELPDGPLPIVVTGVDFAYRDGLAVLHDVSVDIPAGTNVAIVGETGSGKTTLAKLLCRLADPTGGAILLAGLDLRQIDAASRRSQIRMVPQDGFLFEGTIRENIRLGRAGATDEDIDAAVDRLGLRWWLGRLPDGLETQVGERGDLLSVGERQLVALVRVQLADPGLLILDEATSAVDPETERALATALDRLATGRTTVSIAHRLATAETADLVLVFDNGRLHEVGTHTELVAHGKIYARLHQSWLGNVVSSPSGVSSPSRRETSG